MKLLNLLLFLAFGAISAFSQGVNLTSIHLPFPVGISDVNTFHSIMRLEGKTLYVPTSNGMYSLDLNNTGAGWHLQGFEGENLIECVHKGDEWLAITRNRSTNLLLRSADGGKTFVDYTPYGLFQENTYRQVWRLCQDPTNADVIYLLSGYAGLLKSEDFGKSWRLLTDCVNANSTYCGFEMHPLNANILVQHAENGALEPAIQISYNGGINWINSWGYPTPDITLPDYPKYSEDCIHDVAFHPTDTNIWIFGGEGVITKSTDCGKTWTHKGDSWGYHYVTLFDARNPDVVFSVGVNNKGSGYAGYCFYVSTDCGETWRNVYTHVPATPSNSNYSDIKQTDDSLIILGEEELYFVKKRELLANSGVQNVTMGGNERNNNVYSIDGILLMHDASKTDLLKLPVGIYIYNKEKIAIR